ncbi:MAG TPA: porin family protein, partial [Pseudolabrys sp.]|nr:porin family protein [Pseudolabrys sp.]
MSKVPVAPAVYDWTGFYIGANIGYGVGRNGTDQSVLAPLSLPDQVGSFKISPAGVLGGIQGGYNWQTGRLVL